MCENTINFELKCGHYRLLWAIFIFLVGPSVSVFPAKAESFKQYSYQHLFSFKYPANWQVEEMGKGSLEKLSIFENFEHLANPSKFNVFKVRLRKTRHRGRPHNFEHFEDVPGF